MAVLEKLCVQWNVTSLVFQTIGEPHSQMVETALERLAKEKGLEVRGLCGGLCGATPPDPCATPLTLAPLAPFRPISFHHTCSMVLTGCWR